MSLKIDGPEEEIDKLEKLLEDGRKDRDRLDWLERQAGHVFDKSSGGGFRFCWRKGDKETVRDILDKGIAQDVEFSSVNTEHRHDELFEI